MPDRKLQRRCRTVLVWALLGMIWQILQLDRGTVATMYLAAPPMFLLGGCLLERSRAKQNRLAWVGAAYILWFWLSRALLGDFLLEDSYFHLCNLSAAFLAALPYAGALEDGERQRGLRAVTVCMMIVFGLLAWRSLNAALSKEVVSLPIFKTKIGITLGDKRLFTGTNPNSTACLNLLTFMLCMHLGLRAYRRWLFALFLPVLAVLYMAIALTVSRTVMIQVSLFVGGTAALACLHLTDSRSWTRWLIAIPVGAACVFVCYQGFGMVVERFNAYGAQAEELLVGERSLLADLGTLTGRTDIYKRAIQLFIEQPRILLTGVLDSDLRTVCTTWLQHDHTHNALLQTALHYGLPALLMVLYLLVRAALAGIRLLRSPKARLTDQMLPLMLLVLLVGGITEPYLFTDNLPICNFVFCLVLGYVLEIERTLKA